MTETSVAVQAGNEPTRGAFEAWAKMEAPGHSLARTRVDYDNYPTQCAWRGYQAGFSAAIPQVKFTFSTEAKLKADAALLAARLAQVQREELALARAIESAISELGRFEDSCGEGGGTYPDDQGPYILRSSVLTAINNAISDHQDAKPTDDSTLANPEPDRQSNTVEQTSPKEPGLVQAWVSDAGRVHWDLFPGYLIDRHEGDQLTEEGLQLALHDMLSNADYRRIAAERASEPSSVNARSEPRALKKYQEIMAECDEPNALERLRFFCSFAMPGQDWLDSEKFFDDVSTQLGADDPTAEMLRAGNAALDKIAAEPDATLHDKALYVYQAMRAAAETASSEAE